MRHAVLTCLLLLPTGAAAQVTQHVAALNDGTVRFMFDTRPGVEICDQGIRMNDDHVQWRSYGDQDRPLHCRTGVAEVEIEVRRGLVRDIDIVRNEEERDPEAFDVGSVDADEAAEFLLSLVYSGATDEAAEDAIFPAMLADVERPWQGILEIARDRSLHDAIRKNALFWLGQEAADAATEGLTDVAMDEREGQEVRNAAIFALSQRPAEESVPILMEVARTGEAAETRKTAMFWLAQSDDARVVTFFEDILLGRRNR